MRDYVLFCVLYLNVILSTNSLPYQTWYSNRKRELAADDNTTTPSDDIVFPDVYTTQVRYSGNSKEDEDFSASGKGLNCVADVCDDAKEYPYDRIKAVIPKITAYNKLFGFLEGSVVQLPSRFKPGVDEESETLCPTITHTKYPKTLKNENSTEKFIVNVDGHKQGLVFETCVEKAKCKFASLFPQTYVSECSQRYARRRLMALGEDGNPAFDTFIVPSCCVCTITKSK